MSGQAPVIGAHCRGRERRCKLRIIDFEPQGRIDMRTLLAATALLAVMGATPSMARDYPWCSRTSATGFNPSCTFTSYNQCMATVSGQRGDCMQNPLLAFGDQRRGKTSVMRNQADAWDNGWNNNWDRRW